MNLPDDVRRLIKEYSMPLTHPNWRTLHKMPYDLYFDDFLNECCERDSYDKHRRPYRPKSVFDTLRYIRMFYPES